jgi:hypothetical protein
MAGAYGTYTPQVTAGVTSSNARIVQVANTSTATVLKVITNHGIDVFWRVEGMYAQ